jgi:hypothetical protein
MDEILIPKPCDDVVGHLTDSLTERGLDVHLSFDLQSARRELANPEGCPCPYHGTVDCSCQYIVVLAGRPGLRPVSIVAHGHEDQTRISLDPGNSDPADQATIEAVGAVLSSLVSRPDSAHI